MYKRFNDIIVLRVAYGEDIVDAVKDVCLKENVKAAEINGLGAANSVTFAIYDVPTKKFYTTKLDKMLEITNLQGNVSTKNGEYYSHLHITVADETGSAFGGHLISAIIGGTAEIFIHVLPGTLERVVDPQTGLNVFDI